VQGMRERTVRLVRMWVIAGSLAAFDLWVNAFLPTPEWAYHHRSAVWAITCTVLLVAIVPLTKLPSNAVTLGAGFLSGGVLGNLISGAADHLTVPNPLMIGTSTGGIAFNFADAFILIGNLILMVSLSVFVIRHRRELKGLRELRAARMPSSRNDPRP
jgi:thiosulfate reductase cytochrome b subunit